MSSLHQESIQRAYTSLEGLSVGDAFGEQFFTDENYASLVIQGRTLPVPPDGYVWSYTDDTNMALSIVASLNRFEKIDQNWLAQSFAEHYDHSRGYGVGMYRLLEQIKRGKHWTQEAKRLFYGEGSFGNGAAMRVAPVGAYFADDLNLVVEQAILSAGVTHAHLEGIAGAISVAVATAIAWRWGQAGTKPNLTKFLEEVLPFIPQSEVKVGVEKAFQLPQGTNVKQAVRVLGNGSEITAQDTVPYVLWCAAQYLDNYEEALWFTVSGFGDRDATCAMVGGIVACYTGSEAIPQEWKSYQEPLPEWAFQTK